MHVELDERIEFIMDSAGVSPGHKKQAFENYAALTGAEINQRFARAKKGEEIVRQWRTTRDSARSLAELQS